MIQKGMKENKNLKKNCCPQSSITDLTPLNPSAWGHLKSSSYCDVGRFPYRVFKF
jgi:hypothetical protein